MQQVGLHSPYASAGSHGSGAARGTVGMAPAIQVDLNQKVTKNSVSLERGL